MSIKASSTSAMCRDAFLSCGLPLDFESVLTAQNAEGTQERQIGKTVGKFVHGVTRGNMRETDSRAERPTVTDGLTEG